MRILWISDSPDAPSGFGMVTRAVCRRLAQRGHKLEILGWQRKATTISWEGIPVRPVRHDAFGADVLVAYLLRFQPDVVITLADIWWMSWMTDPPVQRYLDQSGCRWLLYYPLDGATPDGRLPAGWIKVLQAADVPVAMSHFGREIVGRCGIESAYVPHGCELDVFTPPADRAAAKARLGYDGRFVVLSDARNQPRKLLPRLLDIAAGFAPGRDDVVFHLHSDPDDSSASSELYHYALREDIAALGLGERVRLTAGFRMRTEGGLTIQQLAAIYQAADVHLLTSWGEGFGLPTLQAASAGVVPMAVAYSASRELVEGHGVAIAPESDVIDEFGMRRCLLDRRAAIGALEALDADRAGLEHRRLAARAFALPYGWDAVVDEWERVLYAAPPRRRPDRSGGFAWIGGSAGAEAGMPAGVAAAATPAFAKLPEGATVTVRMAERSFGAVAAEIHADTFREGDFISVPVRLPPGFPDAPRPRVGNLLCAPSDLALAARLKRIFPGVAVSVPKPPDDPTGARFLTLEELIPALVHYALVIDLAGEAPPGTDLACAALGVPYLGPSALWPPVGGRPLAAARLLLTDPGLSSRRRDHAVEAARRGPGDKAVDAVRALALTGQPDAEDAAARTPPRVVPDDVETLIVRLHPGAGADERILVGQAVAAQGGLVLMVTATGSMIVLASHAGKAAIESHPHVAMVGGISLDDDAPGAGGLKKLFAANAVRQLQARGGPNRLTSPQER